MSFGLYVKKFFTAIGLSFIAVIFMNILSQLFGVILRLITDSTTLQDTILFGLTLIFLVLIIYQMRVRREEDFKFYSMNIYDGQKFDLKKEMRSVMKSDVYIAETAVCGTLTLFLSLIAFLSKGSEAAPKSFGMRLFTGAAFLVVLSVICFVSNTAVWAFVRRSWHKSSTEIKEKYDEKKRLASADDKASRFKL